MDGWMNAHPKCNEVWEVCGSRRLGWVGYTVSACELPPAAASWVGTLGTWPGLPDDVPRAAASAIPFASAS
jgi:hypothetical protein